MDIGFQVQGQQAFVLRGDTRKEIPRDTVLEIYQLVLGNIAPNRDYSSVTSLKKLARIVDLECEPDESDDEESEAAPIKAAPAKAKGKPAPRTVRKAAPAKAAPVADSDSDDSDDSDDEE